jgi:nucleoside-diphosphate-sugar epimerase
MPRILITGANSFVGKNFHQFSQFREIDEVSVYGYKPGDIDFSKYDVILHLAAIVHQTDNITESEYFSVNKDLTLIIADSAKKAGVSQFVFLSTLKVYGSHIHDGNIRNENSNCYPDDPYGKSKLEAEISLKKLEDDAFKVAIIRTPLVYGEGVKSNFRSLIKLVEKVPLLPFKQVNNKRNYTYIENLVGFIDQIILKRVSGLFIAMDDEAISTTVLVNYISKYLGKKVILFKLPGFFIKIGTYFIPKVFDRLYGSLEVENRQTLEILNYKPQFSTEEGIKKMFHLYQNKISSQSKMI